MRRSNPLLASILATAILVFPASACRPQPADSVHQVSSEAAIAFAAAVAALEVLDTLHAARVAALPDDAPDDQVAWAYEHKDRLKRLRDALAIVRTWLDGQTEDLNGRAAFRDAAALLQLLVDDLEQQGVKLPDAVRAGLVAAKLFG